MRAYSSAAPILGHHHLLQLKSRLVERLERDRAHHDAIGERAEMLPRGVVGKFLARNDQAEWPPEHCLAQAEALAIEVGAEHGLDDGDVGFTYHAGPHG